MAIKKTKHKQPEDQHDYFKPLIGFLIILVVAAFVLIYFRFQVLSERQQAGPFESDSLISRVGDLMLIPEGDPAVATVSDPEKLKSSYEFFSKAQKGDKVLIFEKQAILYRPAIDKIINVGPVFYEEESSEESPADSEEAQETLSDTDEVAEEVVTLEEPIIVEIRNGSGIPGAAGELAAKLNEMKTVEVAAVGDAASYDYQETVVVNLAELPEEIIAEMFDGVVVDSMPQSEAGSDSQVLIIIGQ